MPTLRFQTIHRPDRSPSQRFRYEQYLDYFRQHGFSLEFSYLLNEEQDRIYYRPGHWAAKAAIVMQATAMRWRETFEAAPDITFVQRESYMLGSSWFERQMARRSALIFDFDDAIWLADVSHQNRGFGWLKSAKKTGEIIAASHEVIAGNAYLADYARQFNPRTSVIPTTIDTDYHRPFPRKKTDNEPICIGWTGSLTTVPYFHAFSPLLIKLKQRFGERICFKLIGDATYKNAELGLQGDPWRLASEIEDLNQLDIGIMPLPDDPWTRGKCGFKGLQYMACGIPAVMSRVGVNLEIIQDGQNGYLANTDEEWFEKLSQLVESEELRQRLGQAGRQTVLERYSVLSQRDRYLSILHQAMQQRSSASAGRSNP
jgi:glycosyltransferase involved in cell wall biosynthesis